MPSSSSMRPPRSSSSALCKPNVLVKGGDYNAEAVVGAREVQSWGGDVKIVPLVEGFSTTRLIEKGAGR